MARDLGSRWDRWKGRRYRKRRRKECFAKCSPTTRLRYADLTYVEGFAALQPGRPVHHAWCITRGDDVVDPTWSTDADETTDYFGIPFPAQLSAKISLGYHGNHLSALCVDADLRAELEALIGYEVTGMRRPARSSRARPHARAGVATPSKFSSRYGAS